MSGGNGTKYVSLVGDKTTHILAGNERTSCGIPIPIAGGAEWNYAEPEKVCPACTKVEDKAAELTVERAPFEEGVAMPLASDTEEAAPKKAKAAK